MIIENIKELKRNIVVYGMKTTGIEKEESFTTCHVVESLFLENDKIIYFCNTYSYIGEDDTTCAVVIYNNTSDFLKATCTDIIKSINEASYYNTFPMEG